MHVHLCRRSNPNPLVRLLSPTLCVSRLNLRDLSRHRNRHISNFVSVLILRHLDGARISTTATCDERHYAEPISSSLATQTNALGVPTQQLVVNKRLIIHNSAVPGRPPNGTCACGEPGAFCSVCRGTGCGGVSAQETSPRGRRRAASCATSITSVGVGCPKQLPGRWHACKCATCKAGLWNRRPT